jgi:protease I
MELENKSAAIFIADLFEDVELTYPYYRMQEAGARVFLLGKEEAHPYTGKHGITEKSDLSVRTADPSDFDFLIIPGGYSPDKMRMEPKFIEFTRKIHEQGKIIAAICHAPWVLASAGIIRGKKITSWPSLRDDLVNAGAEHIDEEVVVDGNIITSRMPADLPVFCRMIIQQVSGKVPAGSRR